MTNTAPTAARAPLWSLAFPEIPAGEMPAIPTTWRDISWQNDCCPHFLICGSEMGRFVSCWIERADTSERESGSPHRFTVSETMPDASQARMIYEGDDFAEAERLAIVEQLAWDFACKIQDDMTAAEWAGMRFANRSAPAGTCASHDARDSNMDMHAAFLDVIGRDAIGVDGMSDHDIDLWNAAWGVATPHYLTCDDDGMRSDMWRMTGRYVDSLRDAGAELGHDGDARGRVYSAGFIECYLGNYVVNVSNMSEGFPTVAQAERFLWDAFARAESAYDASTPPVPANAHGSDMDVAEALRIAREVLTGGPEGADPFTASELSAAAGWLSEILDQNGCAPLGLSHHDSLTGTISVIIRG